jgi:uncharacterized protein DUF664
MRYALSPVADGSRWLLLSPLLSAVLRVRSWVPSPSRLRSTAPPLLWVACPGAWLLGSRWPRREREPRSRPVIEKPVSGESGALLSSLNSQREHVIGILDGLPGEALRRPVLPSGWTCLGLVRHLAIDVERFWFQSIIAGEQVELCEGAEAWQVGEDPPGEAVFGLYRQEIERANQIIASSSLDTSPA